MYHRLRRDGRLLRENAWETCTLFDINFRPSDMTVEQLDKGFKGLVQRLYSHRFTNWRKANFRKMLRET